MEDRLLALLSGTRDGVLTTIKRDGRPQLSNVGFTFADGVIRISVTDGRAKTANLRRDPRASFYATAKSFRSYAVAEGTAELTPVAADPHDATVTELVEVYRAIAGEHPDWDEYRAAMVNDRRLVVRIPVTRVYGVA
ncbi:MAG: TIGR03618 family F420-dependent PPOX class oxidoreductase [Actinophytocola sp.]|uniref:PPOX class F420-dependent oxidoreductase n=1 Tax=Actinophytocola sp. TaxID=1872138 RepID=UPI0013221829|nr:PPOX class F420-dependent oxidoreductase [Actinophytocola sp.]MPZ83133.1 TIGR03618 family F420-dependent PPOX class oxidoreductase [Actinophytocola sp.]